MTQVNNINVLTRREKQHLSGKIFDLYNFTYFLEVIRIVTCPGQH